MLKKIFISLFLGIYLLVGVAAKPALAAEPTWYHSEFKDWFLKVTDPTNGEDIFAERYASAQVEWVFYGFVSFVLNSIFGTELAYCIVENTDLITLGTPLAGQATSALQIFVRCPSQISTWLISLFRKALTFGPPEQYLASENEGLFGKIFLDNRPISGIGYIKDKAADLGVVQDAYAQDSGFGFTAAVPVQNLWAAARDITYFFMILAIVVMAFMIMFRVKNSPQTVITIQSALPRLVLGVILVTFSYAIAGLMIDLMYVAIGILASILVGSGLFQTTDWGQMYGDLSGATTTLTTLFTSYNSLFLLSFISTGVGFISSIASIGLIPIAMMLIVPIVMFIILIKVAWALIKNFITILLLIAAGPLVILGGVIGGGGISGWLKSLASKLAVYPAVGFLFALSFFFLGNSMAGIVIDNLNIIGWVQRILNPGALQAPTQIPFEPNPDVMDNSIWAPPFTNPGGAGLNIIWLAASLITISLIPKVADIIQSAIAGKPFAYGSAIGAPVAAAGAALAMPFAPVGKMMNEKWGAYVDTQMSKFKEVFLSRFKTKA